MNTTYRYIPIGIPIYFVDLLSAVVRKGIQSLWQQVYYKLICLVWATLVESLQQNTRDGSIVLWQHLDLHCVKSNKQIEQVALQTPDVGHRLLDGPRHYDDKTYQFFLSFVTWRVVSFKALIRFPLRYEMGSQRKRSQRTCITDVVWRLLEP